MPRPISYAVFCLKKKIRAGSSLPGVSGQGSWAGSSLRHSSNSTDTMLRRTIEFSLQIKFIGLLATAALVLMGGYSVRHIPLVAFFFNDTATTEIYTLSLHDALPI